MSRTLVNFWLDVCLLVAFLSLIWTNTVIRFLFPPATEGVTARLWGGSLDDWIGIQFILTCIMTLAVLLHVMLHWSWVCGVMTAHMVTRRDGKKVAWDDGTRTLIGVGLLIVLLNVLGLGLAAASLTIQK